MTLTTRGDEERRQGLRRTRFMATGLLVLAAIVFVLTHDRGGFWGYVNAGAEASMIGAVADWFAVTALFRHPLRLPIPHTAIIPRRKDSLATSLEQFFHDNFLTADTIRDRFLSAQVARRVGVWLAEPAHSRRIVSEATPFVRRLLDRIHEDDMRSFIQQTVLPRVRHEEVSPMAGALLGAVVEDGAHRGVVDIVARELHTWFVAHPTDVKRILAARAPWWSPQWLDETVINRVYQELVVWSQEIRDEPDHRIRQALDSYLAQLAEDLQHDEHTRERLEGLKERVLDHPQAAATVLRLWEAVKVVVLEALEDEDGHLRTRLATELTGFGARLQTDEELRGKIDEWSADAAVALVERYGAELTTVISSTIDRWDGEEAAKKIELHVGRDLQFIRINGTVVGGLVGVTIHALIQLFGNGPLF